MGKIAVTCLGSGAALGGKRLWSSLLLDDRIVLSLPPTSIPQLYRLNKDVRAIDYIFISHRHADHFFGLPFLLLLYCYLYERKDPLYIIGPSGMKEATESLFDLSWPELKSRGITPRVPLTFVEVDRQGEFRAGELGFRAVRLNHFGAETYGYRFAYKDREIAFTGDTGECAQLHELLDGVDVVVTEFTHAFESEDKGHMDAPAVSRLAKRLTAKGATVLATHLSGEPLPIEGLLICRDGETYIV
jgi:ribonuclease BN (tRNA processing enzyme)